MGSQNKIKAYCRIRLFPLLPVCTHNQVLALLKPQWDPLRRGHGTSGLSCHVWHQGTAVLWVVSCGLYWSGSVWHILCELDQIQICGIWKTGGHLELYTSFHRPFLSSFCCVGHIVLVGRLGLCHWGRLLLWRVLDLQLVWMDGAFPLVCGGLWEFSLAFSESKHNKYKGICLIIILMLIITKSNAKNNK